MKFYSETLDKIFDTETELKEAEDAVAKAKAKKAKAAEEKKSEAKKVEDAFKARNAARKTCNAKIAELRKAYTEELIAQRKAFEEAVKAESDKADATEKAYSAALKEFTDKHPEGYHMTLKDGDNVVTLSTDKTVDFGNLINKSLNDWFEIFKLF